MILADANTHMMPALALEMARRNHDFVLGDAKDGLADELINMGAKVEVVPDTTDQTREDTIPKLVDRAMNAFGDFDSACIRTGTYGTDPAKLKAVTDQIPMRKLCEAAEAAYFCRVTD